MFKALSPEAVRSLLVAMLLLFCCPSWAVIEIAPLPSEELEARYRDLIEELRCPKCQNQNLADSNAPIAADLREQVRKLLEQGRSDDEIVEFLVERYGDFVRYKPALQGSTLVLWFAPALLLVVGLAVIYLVVRTSRRSQVGTGELKPEERERLAELLDRSPASIDRDHRGDIAE